jgi:L-lactate dehydrogenase complex protein LldG
MTDRARFMATVRRALGNDPEVRRKPPAGLFPESPPEASLRRLERARRRSLSEREALLALLIEAAAPIHLKVVPVKGVVAVSGAIADLIREKTPEWGDRKAVAAWRHPLIERLELSATLADQHVPVFFSDPDTDDARDRMRREVIDSYIGITSADWCVADTATLVLKTRPGQARSVSLVPSIHLAVIEVERIVRDLKELYALLRWEGNGLDDRLSGGLTLISGPSKTADIEATLVHGAHGPRELHLIVVA